jgi:GTPase SAR1 family protein
MTQINNILLIGRTGGGKSTLANVLSRSEKFKESDFSVPETREIQVEEFEQEVILSGNDNLKIKFRVIDTVGIGDTSLSTKQVLTEISKAIDVLKYGLYQVLFVIGGKFTEQEIEVYDLLKDVIFDSQIAKYITIVRTKFPDFDKEEACTEEKKKLNDESKKLAELIRSCNGLICVDNPPMKERYVNIARDAREESRKRLILHLISNCGNYFPVSLSDSNKRINGYKTRAEILERKVEYWKGKYNGSCSIS